MQSESDEQKWSWGSTVRVRAYENATFLSAKSSKTRIQAKFGVPESILDRLEGPGLSFQEFILELRSVEVGTTNAVALWNAMVINRIIVKANGNHDFWILHELTKHESFETLAAFAQSDGDDHMLNQEIDADASNLASLLENRASSWAFNLGELSNLELTSILLYAYGGTPSKTYGSRQRRTVSSAGASYPLRFYVFSQSIHGLSSGLKKVEFGEKISFRALQPDSFLIRKALLTKTVDLSNLSAAIFILIDPNVCFPTYGPRSYRYSLIEAGLALQNMQLRCTELGLKFLTIGAVDDTYLESEANCDQELATACCLLVGR